jgi:hypothetical protein
MQCFAVLLYGCYSAEKQLIGKAVAVATHEHVYIACPGARVVCRLILALPRLRCCQSGDAMLQIGNNTTGCWPRRNATAETTNPKRSERMGLFVQWNLRNFGVALPIKSTMQL